MSMGNGLMCRTHMPHLAERLDGFENDYGQRKLRDLWRFRDVLIPAVRVFNGEQLDERPPAALIGSVGDRYESHALYWMSVHSQCDVAILTEYDDVVGLA